jgi:hypothetical protein
MSLATEVRGELEDLMAGELSEFSVAVVIAGTTGTGLCVNEQQTTDFGPNGETGVTGGTVRVSAATFEKPARGATMLIDGDPATVMQVDGSGALWVIQYRRVRKVEGA